MRGSRRCRDRHHADPGNPADQGRARDRQAAGRARGRTKSAPIVALTALLLGLGPGVSQAAYPERVITLIVPFAAGGPTDIIARIVSVAFPRLLGQNVIVENRGGGGGNPGMAV